VAAGLMAALGGIGFGFGFGIGIGTSQSNKKSAKCRPLALLFCSIFNSCLGNKNEPNSHF
jgi:hypothetical protein